MTYSCGICPNNCVITESEPGRCRTRFSDSNGELSLPYFGALSALSIDPIEKKPLYNYFPGSSILSAGFYGCSLSCPFCQNYNISKEFSDLDYPKTSPERLVELAGVKRSFGIAYTYSEPLIHYEYLLETSRIARKNGIRNIVVTNGYINKQPAEKLLPELDALNIDLKSFNPDFYRDELKGRLEPVLEFIQLAAQSCHVELTTLVIPGKNDSAEEIDEISSFIADINRKIPLHLSAYHPSYRYRIKSTEAEHLTELSEIASEKLDYVYTGNISAGITNTNCPVCGSLLIRRNGYSVQKVGLNNGSCSSCGTSASSIGIILNQDS